MMVKKSLTERFWAKVEKGDECWRWTGAHIPNGYGVIRVNNITQVAHRIAYQLSTGVDPGELWVLHRCDNRSCVRPDHLFLGTRLDNIRDAQQKGRLRSGNAGRYGEQAANSRISDQKRRDIMAWLQRHPNQSDAARLFRVSPATVHRLVKSGRYLPQAEGMA